MERPFISIVTVSYNSETTIERTIKSILEQNFTDYEYIIVDGASTDSTVDVIRKYEPLFNGRMKWVSEPDKGIYDAFNKGCKWAKGNYIWIVNSDDFIEPNSLRIIKDIHDQQGRDVKKMSVLIGRMNYISDNGKIIFVSKKISKEDLARAYSHDTMGLTHPATIVPKIIYEEVGYYDDRFKISADIDWFNRAYQKKVSFIGFDDVITNMVAGGVSTGGTSLSALKKDRLLSFKKKYSNSIMAYVHLYRWLGRVIYGRMMRKIISIIK